MTNGDISAYVRAWARHGILIGFASVDAAARGGLSPMEAAGLCGAMTLESCRGTMSAATNVPADVVVEDDALAYRFSYGHPDPARRGAQNHEFLEPHGFVERLLPFLDVHRGRIRVVVLRLAPLSAAEGLSFRAVMRRLDHFLALLPRPYRYALEPPDGDLLRPEYFACLRFRGVAHAFAEGDALLRRLPPVSEQFMMVGLSGASYCVVRTVVWSGVPGIQWPRPDVPQRRQGWVDAVRQCLAAGIPLHLLVDDEIDPLGALGVLLTTLNGDLARLSRLRRRAA